jgi:hypothetical protein
MNHQLNRIKHVIYMCMLLSCITTYSQLNREVFHEDFEKTTPNIQAIWTPTTNYSVVSGFSGNGLLFDSPTLTNNLTSSTTISLTNLQGTTIALSAAIKGENLVSDGFTGMVIQLVAEANSGSLRYYRIAIEKGTFDWKQVGKAIKIDEDIKKLSLNIGIYNATGKLWVDNLHIQVISWNV